MMTVARFEVVNIDKAKYYRIGIKDHEDDRIVVMVNEIVDDKTTVSIAEDIISVIENHLAGEDNGSED